MRRFLMLTMLCLGCGGLGWFGASWADQLPNFVCETNLTPCPTSGSGIAYDGQFFYATMCTQASGHYRLCVADPGQSCDPLYTHSTCSGVDAEQQHPCIFFKVSCGVVP